jgi:hypothetical protein
METDMQQNGEQSSNKFHLNYINIFPYFITTVIILSFVQICNEGCQTDPLEILEILFVVCEEFKLPIVQTRVPCKHQCLLSHGGGVTKSSSSFAGSCMEEVCISTSGVAFDSCKPYFSKDFCRFAKMEYPLVHYFHIFGLAGYFSICLQNAYTRDDDYMFLLNRRHFCLGEKVSHRGSTYIGLSFPLPKA